MNINTFDLNLLKTFQALFAEGSVTKAAERLGVTQPAASASLRRLREVFGDPLFVRTGQRLEPTQVALDLRSQVEQTLAGVAGMLELGSVFDPARLDRTFWLSGSDFFSQLLLPKLLERLRLEAPSVKIVFVDQVFGTTLGELENGKVDLAFWPRVDMPKWVSMQYLFTTQFQHIARIGHNRLVSAGIKDGDPIPVDLVCDLAHVHFSPDGRTLDDMDQVLAKMGRRRKIHATVPTFSAVIDVVNESDLIGTLPFHTIDALGGQRNFTRHPLAVERPEIPLMMYWHRRAENSLGHRWLRGLVHECLTP